jgi:O-antigen/teichoic acid export membrane protein
MLILDAYFGLIYKAIQTDYFPRISAISHQKSELSSAVSQQAIIGLLIIIPIIMLFMAFMPFVLELLYTEKFIILTRFMNWALLGLLFKTASWTIGITIIAKADTNLFIKTSILFNSLFLILSLLGFYFFSLEGVGFAYFVYYILHFIGLMFITKWRYQLKLNPTFNYVFLMGLLLCSLSFCSTFIDHSFYKYLASILLFFVGLTYSIYKLNAIANLKLFFKSLFNSSK